MLWKTNIFYLCHTLLKLLIHPVHCPVATPAPDFTVFMKHEKSPF